jgi:HAD superfamily hydrolase (TIGR01490 family)
MRSPDNRNDPVRLAIFDLDNTLITSDSDHLWGEYLAERGIVDGEHYRRRNDQYLAEYQAGTLDIHDFLRFSLRVLAEHDPAELARLRAGFIEEKIAPTVAPGAPSLLARHRDAGDHLMIITATNSFVTEPIARMLGVETLIATEPEQRDGRYTGDVTGTPCFREGKVERLGIWLAENGAHLQGSAFYSDSHNDLPLLEQVERPCAVDPDEQLAAAARERNWPVISLRGG